VGLDEMLIDAGHREFDVLLVWAAGRLARSVRHFLEVLDELKRLDIEFVSLRENIDTGGPLGRAVMVIVGAVAELRNLIIERVKAGMRRARLDGRHIGRKPLNVDRASIFRHHIHGHSLKEISRTFNISRTSVARIIRAEKKALPKGGVQMRLEELENTASQNAA
jgi:DNA invertase Pin-like site-specific DNA recombinase